MTPKEKAKELVTKFKKYSRINTSGFLVSNEDTLIVSAKQCAIIAVDEIINETRPDKTYNYWFEVKDEIKKL